MKKTFKKLCAALLICTLSSACLFACSKNDKPAIDKQKEAEAQEKADAENKGLINKLNKVETDNTDQVKKTEGLMDMPIIN